jgi:hypothetical protein
VIKRRFGKALFDSEKEMWKVAARGERFLINRRLVDTSPEVKATRHVYSKAAGRNTPSVRKADKRKEFLEEVDGLRREYQTAIRNAFEEIRKDSFRFPIPLRLDKDYDHTRQWMYCMYEGEIYQLDKTGYSDEEIIQQIKGGTQNEEKEQGS